MIDPLTNRLYWSNFSDGDGTTISWASLDGTDDGDLLQVGTTGEGPEGTAIDPATRKIYWSDYGNWTLLQYADVDLGTGVSPFEPARGRRPMASTESRSTPARGGSTGPTTAPTGSPMRASTVTEAAISMCRVRVTRSAAPSCRRS